MTVNWNNELWALTKYIAVLVVAGVLVNIITKKITQ